MTPEEFKQLSLEMAKFYQIPEQFALYVSELYNTLYSTSVAPANQLVKELFAIDGTPAGSFLDAIIVLLGVDDKDITIQFGTGKIFANDLSAFPYNYTIPIRSAYFIFDDNVYTVSPFYLHKNSTGLVEQVVDFVGTNSLGKHIVIGDKFYLYSTDPIEQQYLNGLVTYNNVGLEVTHISESVHQGFSQETVRQLLIDSIKNFRMLTPKQLETIVKEKLDTLIAVRTII